MSEKEKQELHLKRWQQYIKGFITFNELVEVFFWDRFFVELTDERESNAIRI
jgi:hypothetical protein